MEVKHFVQDICYAGGKVSSIFTSTSIASLLPFLLPVLLPNLQLYCIENFHAMSLTLPGMG